MDGNGPGRVLHVDDDEEVRDLTAAFLEREADLVVETATSASEGLERLEAGDIECIVSDYDMPGTDGLEFLTAVRERGLDVPFILFTGHGNEAVASEAISAGVSDYLQKGMGTEQYEVLANRVHNYATQYRTEREIERVRESYELVAHTTSDAIYEWDAERDDIPLSVGFDEQFGADPPDHPDQSWWLDRIHPDDRADVVARLDAATADAETEVHLEYRFRHASDGYRYVSEDRHQVYDEEGRVRRVVAAFRDVTDVRRREQRLDALHDASRDLIAVTDDEGVVETVSRAAEEILDLPINAVYWRDGDELVPETYTEAAADLLGTPPPVNRGRGLMWEAFAEGEVRSYADVTEHRDVFNDETAIRSEFFVPFGDRGLFVAGSTVPDDFGEADVTLAKVLVANAEAALARIGS